MKFKKNCPNCGASQYYTLLSNRNQAEKEKKICRKCSSNKLKETMKGVNNPFYGRVHTEEFKEKLSRERKGKHFSPSTEIKKGQILNKNYHLSLKEQMILKYGPKKAEERWALFIERQRKSNTGPKNGMYGKPSPQGAGNGWSGWYKGWFFRSLLELSYMIYVIEKFNITWKTAESEKFKIPYKDWEGKNKNYFSDFILNDKYIVECKPKKLWKTPSVENKIKGAIEFSNKNGYIYKIRDCPKLSINEIIELYKTKQLTFTKKYDELFKQKTEPR